MVCSNSYRSSSLNRGRKVRWKIQSISIKASAGLSTETGIWAQACSLPWRATTSWEDNRNSVDVHSACSVWVLTAKKVDVLRMQTRYAWSIITQGNKDDASSQQCAARLMHNIRSHEIHCKSNYRFCTSNMPTIEMKKATHSKAGFSAVVSEGV